MTDAVSTPAGVTTARSRDPLAFLTGEIEELKAKGLYRRLRVVQSEQRSRCVIDGREVITLSSNNYLGLNTHPRLRLAAIDAVERYGAGSGAVRTIAGTMSLHEELEARLATFKQVEAVLTFQSGFTCNTGVIPILAAEGAAIVSDALNQALQFITRGGRVSLLGIFPEPVAIDLSDLVIQRGIRLFGIYGRRIYDSWERTQALLRSGRFDPTPILTHRFDLADWERGFELIASRHAGKVVLIP